MGKMVQRGYVPSDKREFSEDGMEKLLAAGSNLYYLLNRGYPIKSASVFVGNHYLLSERQRLALVRAISPKEKIRLRMDKELKGSLEAVSYTHLPQVVADAITYLRIACGFIAVSYTHLDVYKRQTLYRARLSDDKSPVQDEYGHYEKGEVYASWISGCLYDDNGNLKLDGNGQPIPTPQPHWIDHIPVGYYVLEETACPYEQGYVQSADVNIHIEETGNVQSLSLIHI